MPDSTSFTLWECESGRYAPHQELLPKLQTELDAASVPLALFWSLVSGLDKAPPRLTHSLKLSSFLYLSIGARASGV